MCWLHFAYAVARVNYANPTDKFEVVMEIDKLDHGKGLYAYSGYVGSVLLPPALVANGAYIGFLFYAPILITLQIFGKARFLKEFGLTFHVISLALCAAGFVNNYFRIGMVSFIATINIALGFFVLIKALRSIYSVYAEQSEQSGPES